MSVPTDDNLRDLAEPSAVALPASSVTAPAFERRFAPQHAAKAGRTRPMRDWHAYLFVCLFVISAGLRLVNLSQVPPFIDEDGYSTFAHNLGMLTWQQVVLDPQRVVKLTGDKPPLAMLLQERVNRLVGDIVVSGRLLSAAAGIATTGLCFWLGRKLGGDTMVGMASMAVYAVSPFAVLHERVVGQDPLMSALSLGAILLAWTAMERGSVRLAVLAGFLGASSVQMKVSGLVTAPIMLMLIVATDRPHRKYWYLLAIGAAGVVSSYVLLMAGPAGSSVGSQNDKLMVPFGSLADNAAVLGDAVATYFPWGLLVLAGLGLAAAVRLRRTAGLVCVGAVIACSIPWLVLSRFAPSRYYLAADPYVCALIGFGAVWVVAEIHSLRPALATVAGCIVAIVFGVSGALSVRLATDFLHAPLSTQDDGQFRSGWPSGYAYRDARDFVHTSLPAGSTLAYMVDTDHRVALGLDRPPPPGVDVLGLVKPGAALPFDSGHPLYVVVDDYRYSDLGSGLRSLLADHPQFRLVAQFPRPGSTGGVSIVSWP